MFNTPADTSLWSMNKAAVGFDVVSLSSSVSHLPGWHRHSSCSHLKSNSGFKCRNRPLPRVSHLKRLWLDPSWQTRAYFDLCLIFLLLRFSLLKAKPLKHTEMIHFFSNASPVSQLSLNKLCNVIIFLNHDLRKKMEFNLVPKLSETFIMVSDCITSKDLHIKPKPSSNLC